MMIYPLGWKSSSKPSTALKIVLFGHAGVESISEYSTPE